MAKHLGMLLVYAFCAVFPAYAHADQDRSEVEVRVRADVTKDLESLWQPDSLVGRVCLDGRPAAEFPGEVVEYWVNMECAFCGIVEPMLAQRQNSGVCIVARHVPTREYGESMKKALSYEARKKFSVNGANIFWDKVIPKTAKALHLPYEASLLLAFQEAVMRELKRMQDESGYVSAWEPKTA